MITSVNAMIRPTWKLLLSHPAHMLSLGFGSGLARKAPGTWGTLMAFPIFWFLEPRIHDLTFLLLLIAGFIIGIRACEITTEALGCEDHGSIVWDEIVAFLLVLYFTPPGLSWAILAFVLFRFFDIIKPQPIRHFDQNWHGGLAVMFDDLVAAGYTLLCLALIKSIIG